jgi:hypothetical protein
MSKKCLTQQQLIIARLKQGWTSPLDALYDCGTMKLSTRVGELKWKGHSIIDVWHESRKYKLYRMAK